MKKLVAAFGLVLFGSTAFGQTESLTYQTVSRMELPSVSTQGVRVALLKPFLNRGITAEGRRIKIGDIKDSLGYAIGYAHLPIRELGFTTNLAYLAFWESEDSLVRLDGNLGYAFDEIVNFKGGLNGSQVTGFREPRLGAALGIQAGVGFQINPLFGIDISYVMMRQTGSSSVAMDESGFEFAVHGTF
jgi:hypothetical protein